MKELLRSNDPVYLSYVQHLLREAGINAIILDQHTSVLEGSINAIERRVMVEEDQHERAIRLLSVAAPHGH